MDAIDYLARYAIAEGDHAFGDVETVHQPPCGSVPPPLTVHGEQTALSKKGELLANGFFLNLDVILPNVDGRAGFRDWLDCLEVVVEGCTNVLELEWTVGKS